MKRNRNLILTIVVSIGIFFVSTTSYATDVTGTWKMAVETGMGSGEATFVLVQNGEAITGTYQGSMGEAPVTGSLKEGNIILKYGVSQMGMDMKIQYSGTAQGDTMKGKVDLGGMGDGTFTGKKQVDPAK